MRMIRIIWVQVVRCWDVICSHIVAIIPLIIDSAEVLLDKAPGMLPGMTADVDIKIKGNENALIIPVEALHQTSAGSFVYTEFDQETQQYGGKVDVVPGMQNDEYAEILSGLEEGDTVYYTQQENIFAFFANMMGMPAGGGR